MKLDSFFVWLKRFDLYIGRAPRGKVLLFIDNCSAHGRPANTTVQFLPPSTKNRIKPLDAGIIAALKVRYRRRFIEYALDQTDKEEYDIYKVDILMAMKRLCDA